MHLSAEGGTARHLRSLLVPQDEPSAKGDYLA
jgi:hypothetical protein